MIFCLCGSVVLICIILTLLHHLSSTSPISVPWCYVYATKSPGLPGILAEGHSIQWCLQFLTSPYYLWVFHLSTPQFHIALTRSLHLFAPFPSQKHHTDYTNQFGSWKQKQLSVIYCVCEWNRRSLLSCGVSKKQKCKGQDRKKL